MRRLSFLLFTIFFISSISALCEEGQININTASLEELDQLYDKLMRSEIDVFESVAADRDEEKPIEDLEKELEALTEKQIHLILLMN